MGFLRTFSATSRERITGRFERVLVGTHSTDIENGLRRLFSDLKWHCQCDFPMNGQVRVDDVVVELGDGVQVWINPSLS